MDDDNPRIPKLVGASESAVIMGITRQGVHERRGLPHFPVGHEIEKGTLYLEDEIVAFDEQYPGLPGRPRNTDAPPAGPPRRGTKNPRIPAIVCVAKIASMRGCTKAAVWARAKRPDFPRGRRTSLGTVYLEQEIRAYIRRSWTRQRGEDHDRSPHV